MRKYLSLIMAIVITLTLVACGGGKKEPMKSLEELGYDPTGLPIVQEQVEYKITSPKNALALPYNDMDVFKNMVDDTNVKINWENLSEETFNTTKQMIISDKRKLPDAMYHAGFSDRDIIQYSAADIILPFDKYLDSMPNFKKILEDRPDIRRVITSPDGHIYALPRIEEMGLLEHPNILFINKDWVNKLSANNLLKFNGKTVKVNISGGNLATDSTEENIKLEEQVITIDDKVVSGFDIDQYEAILKAMKDNSSLLMEDNKAALIPLTFRFNGWQGNQSDLFSAFGVPENIDHLTVVNGKVTYTGIDNNYKKAIENLSDWIKDGLIEKDAFTQDDFTLLSKGKGGPNDKHPKLGSFYWWEKETVISPKWQDQYVPLPPIISRDGKQQVGVSNNQEISKGNFVVFSKAQNPEILLTWIDRFYDPIVSAQINYGPIGIVYEEELKNGMLVNKPIPEGMTADELRLKNAPMGVIYLSKDQWENNVVMEYRARLRLEVLKTFIKPYVYKDVVQYPNVSYQLDEISMITRLKPDIDSFVYQLTSEWLLQGNMTDKDWNDYTKRLEDRMNLSKLIAVYQAAYDRYVNEGL